MLVSVPVLFHIKMTSSNFMETLLQSKEKQVFTRNITYNDVLNQVACFPKLKGSVGLLTNSSEFLAPCLAAWVDGLMVVPICQSHPVPEQEFVLQDATVQTLVYSPYFESRALELATKIPMIDR